MQNRRQILKNAGGLGFGLAAILRAPSVFSQPTTIDGFHQQDWFHETSFDLQKDIETAENNNKTLTLLWEQKGCHYCEKMHKTVFQREDIVELIKNEFLVVQMDYWGEREFRNFDGEMITEAEMARNYFVRGTPTTMFFDDIGDVLFRMPGYGEPPVFKAAFRYVHERAYIGQSFTKWIKTQNLDLDPA